MTRHSDSLHQKILDVVATDDLWEKKIFPRSYDLLDTDKLRLLFCNYRFVDNKPHGLRLTYFGEQLMSKYFDSYKFQTDFKACHGAMVSLDKFMEMPYYVGRKYVCFFGEDDAAWFRLNNSNLNDFVEYLG